MWRSTLPGGPSWPTASTSCRPPRPSCSTATAPSVRGSAAPSARTSSPAPFPASPGAPISQPDPPATAPRGIDPRSPRFGAGITAVLLLVDIFLWLVGATAAAAILLLVIALLFAWGAFAGVQRHPYGALYRAVVRPRLAPPAELEDPAPPTFARAVGLLVTGVGLVLFAVGLPLALPIAAALAFIAAFLNSVFGYCLGCQLYLLLVRARVIRHREGPEAA